MVKRSRLRSGRRTKGRLVLFLAPAGVLLLLGLLFFTGPEEHAGAGVAEENQVISARLLESRGTIYDRSFKELAHNLEQVSVYANVKDVDAADVADKLAPVLDRDSEQLQNSMESEPYRAWLAKNITQEEELRILQLDLDGVFLDRQTMRYYPQKKTGAHIVGYVGEGMGLAGIEHSYNRFLNMYKSDLLAAGAESIAEKSTKETGDRYLVLTVDVKIQRKLEKLVTELGRKKEGVRVGAMLMESESGKVIGQAGYPSYDPNTFRHYNQEELGNILAEPIAIPEKLRKIFWDASLLQYRFEQDGTTLPWSVEGRQRNLGSQLRLWERLGLNDSLDIDFIKQGKNDERSFQQPAGGVYQSWIDSMVESATPMRIATALNGLYIGGRVPLPHVADRIAGEDGDILKLNPKRGEEAVDGAVAQEIRNMLKAQMQSGPLSSRYLESSGLAYRNSSKGRSYRENRLYFSMIPHDTPELLLFVFAQFPPVSPSQAKTKSRFVIADAVKKVTVPMVAMEKVMSNLSDMMHVQEKEEMNFVPAKIKDISNQLPQAETAAAVAAMPDLKGLSLRKSLRRLQNLKLEIQISGTGVVVAQEPRAGLRVERESLCRLVLKPH
ncbi:MAG: PASTA domain-containing protein [Desulfopila sp.]